MALLDNFKIGTVGAGIAIGIGALILAPALIPAVATAVRPIAKAAVKSGLILFEKTREVIAEAQETIADIAAEAHAELASERQTPPAEPDPKAE